MAFRACLIAIGFLNVFANVAWSQGYQPSEAIKHVSVTDGLKVTLFASEPAVRQPILVKVDDRGRLWTIQYLQYPNPAGLKRVKVDRWSRTVYDRVPKPPPHGPKGADRITILDDTDGDGRADSFRDFVTGLNLCTGLEFGHGGVFVLQVPYLLFYPDRDRDDVPDSDPKVLLSGFGMEDAQSLANHLTWGPDGWLYGVNGSTTTCNIRGIEFQQGCWRYHPTTREFELFCEGGGNTYGLTFDENGNLFYSTNGGPFVHALQGAYYRKSFGKHGPLHNPHVYGFFEVVKRDKVPGGPPTGGTIYLADSFPSRFRGRFIAGNFLGHTASWWDIKSTGTTFEAKYAGVLLNSHDTWFGATDMCVAPDGSMFVCDFHDQRTSHPDPDAKWDRSNGRIYNIASDARQRVRDLDLHRQSSDRLVDLLLHNNRWFADRARVELASRNDASVVPRLLEWLKQSQTDAAALQALWAINAVQELDEEIASKFLKHSSEYVRMWTVRLLGDRKRVSSNLGDQLVELATREPSPVVRCQLAATARRLEGAVSLRIVAAILARDLDRNDARIPLMLWWAIEAKSLVEREGLLELFAKSEAWNHPSNIAHITRLIRRWSAEGTQETYQACLKLMQAAPDTQQPTALAALSQGLAERRIGESGIGQGGLFESFSVVDSGSAKPKTQTKPAEPVPKEFRQFIEDIWNSKRSDPLRTRIALQCEVVDAMKHVRDIVANKSATVAEVLNSLRLLSEFGDSKSVPEVLRFVGTGPESIQAAALEFVGRFANPDTTQRLIEKYPKFSPAMQSRARDILFSRPGSAKLFLMRINQDGYSAKGVPIEQLRRIALHADANLDQMVREHWGSITSGSPGQKLALMRRYNNDLRVGGGNAARGKILFMKHCGTCHQLFDEGQKIGPDLTQTNRKDRAAMLAAIVDPNAVIKRQYTMFVVVTSEGQVLNGLLADQDAGSVTLLDAKNKRTRIPRNGIETLRESPTSLMPEKALDKLQPQEVRDLFSYLQK